MATEETIRSILIPSRCIEREGVFACSAGISTGESDPAKRFMRRWPRLYEFLLWITTNIYFYGLSPEGAIRRAFPDGSQRIILNLGSGTSDFGAGVINVDLAPFPGVQVVADAINLPFRDASLDMIISESLLEHVPRPEKAIEEMRRVLKPGGFVYIEMPFLHPFHGSPNDYTRFTLEGLRQGFAGFRVLDAGARAGPVTTLVVQLAYILAVLFSFRSWKLYALLAHFFFVILSPLKIFDQISRLFPAYSHEAANHIYFFARKEP